MSGTGHVPLSPKSSRSIISTLRSYKHFDNRYQPIRSIVTQLQSKLNTEFVDDAIIPDFPKDPNFNLRTTISLTVSQYLLIVAAIATATACSGVDFRFQSIILGCITAIPLGVLAAGLDLIESNYKVLQDVTKATQH
jgi:hypothetical protein